MLIKNKKINHDYIIVKKFEAGLVLRGCEVKSLRINKCTLKESHISDNDSELFLQNISISPYKFTQEIIKNRNIKLLMHKKQINHIISSIKKDGFTAVPVSMYDKRGLIKIEVAIVKGKTKYDKRQSERKKEWEREKLNIKKYL